MDENLLGVNEVMWMKRVARGQTLLVQANDRITIDILEVVRVQVAVRGERGLVGGFT